MLLRLLLTLSLAVISPFLGDFGKGLLGALGINTAPIEAFVANVRAIIFGKTGVATPYGTTIGAADGLVDTLKAPFETFLSYINFWWELAISPINLAVELIKAIFAGDGDNSGVEAALLAPFKALINFVTTLWDNHLKAPFATVLASLKATFITPVQKAFDSIGVWFMKAIAFGANAVADVLFAARGVWGLIGHC